MSWVYVSAQSGYQLTAPSFAPPPPLLGLERLCASSAHSIRLYTAHPACTWSSSDNDAATVSLSMQWQTTKARTLMPTSTSPGQSITVLVEQYDAGAVFGHVVIAVAAETTAELWARTAPAGADCGHVIVPLCLSRFVQRVKMALVSYDASGLQVVLDSLCTRAVPTAAPIGCPDTSAPSGSYGSNAMYRTQLGLQAPLTTSECAAVCRPESPTASPVRRHNASRAKMLAEAWLRRRAFLFFVDANVIPLSPLWCSVRARLASSATTPHGGTQSPPSLSPHSMDTLLCVPAIAPVTVKSGAQSVPEPASAKKSAACMTKHSASLWASVAQGTSQAVEEVLRTVSATISAVAAGCAYLDELSWSAAWQSAWCPEQVRAARRFSLPFAACYSPSGVLTASSSFSIDLPLETQHALAALAIHSLVTPTTEAMTNAVLESNSGNTVARRTTPARTLTLPLCAHSNAEDAECRSARVQGGARPASQGLYDVVMVMIGQALAVVVGFVRAEAQTASPLAAAFAAWMSTTLQQNLLTDEEVTDDDCVVRPTSTGTARHTLATSAAMLCSAATRPWNTAVEQALQCFKEHLEHSTVPRAPLTAVECAPPDDTHDAAPSRGVSAASPATTITTTRTVVSGDVQDSKRGRASRLGCMAALCRRGASSKRKPSASRPSPVPPALTEALATPSPAQLPHSTLEQEPLSGSSQTNAPAVLHAHVRPEAQQAHRRALLLSWLYAAARLVVVERQLSHAVERDARVGEAAKAGQRQSYSWAGGVHSALWCAQQATLSSTSTAQPGYAVGFFRRVLESSESLQANADGGGSGEGDDDTLHCVEDVTSLVRTLTAPTEHTADALAMTTCLLYPRHALLSAAASVLEAYEGAGSRTHSTGTTGLSQSASDSDSDDDYDTSSHDDVSQGGDRSSSLVTCLSVPYTFDVSARSSVFAMQCVVTLHGEHLGAGSDLLASLAAQQPVAKACKGAFVSAEEAKGVEMCTTLLHALQGVSHSVIECAHRECV